MIPRENSPKRGCAVIRLKSVAEAQTSSRDEGEGANIDERFSIVNRKPGIPRPIWSSGANDVLNVGETRVIGGWRTLNICILQWDRDERRRKGSRANGGRDIGVICDI